MTLSINNFDMVFSGALMWWGPTFAYYGAKAKCGNKAGCENITPEGIAYKFGIVMTLAGLLGVPSGSFIAQTLRHKIPNADPIVCGASLILSVPVLFFGFITARFSVDWCYGLTFLAGSYFRLKFVHKGFFSYNYLIKWKK